MNARRWPAFAAWRLIATATTVLILSLLLKLMKGKDLAAPTSVVLIRWIPKKALAQSPEGQSPLGVAQDICSYS